MGEPNSWEDDLAKSLDKLKEDSKELKAKIEQEKRRLDLPVDSKLSNTSGSDRFPTGISTFLRRTKTRGDRPSQSHASSLTEHSDG